MVAPGIVAHAAVRCPRQPCRIFITIRPRPLEMARQILIFLRPVANTPEKS
jgi:hypothetical protein